jgi:hypothetical protein
MDKPQMNSCDALRVIDGIEIRRCGIPCVAFYQRRRECFCNIEGKEVRNGADCLYGHKESVDLSAHAYLRTFRTPSGFEHTRLTARGGSFTDLSPED